MPCGPGALSFLNGESHEGLGLRRKESQKPGASLSCARPAAPREAHNRIDAGWSDGSRSIRNGRAATKPDIKRYVCHADWETHGRAAGPIRNEKMLTWKPDLVVAFPGGVGTADLVRRAEAAGVPVQRFLGDYSGDAT